MPGQDWTGRVTFVSPTLDPKTRTAQVRVEIPNPRRILKPETFADVFLETAMGMAAIVPATAVIRTGERTLVFVDHGGGRYEPREIALGERVSSGYQVLSGVAAGERVVVSATFLLDSESSLRAAIAAVPVAPER
jgi:multidrug efflux pump subunit AcrA (membrane-fusion protein)